MIEIRHLRLIKEIATTGNMTKASERLFLTQPSLSHQLKEIETRLGTQLFLRVNRTLVLSEAGRKVLQAAIEILQKMESLEREIRSIKGSCKNFRISTLCYTCYHWLPSLMKQFQANYPEVVFDVVIEAMNNPIDYILKNKIDLAVTNSKTNDRGVFFEKLFDDEQVLLVPPSHILATREFVKPIDFVNENLVIYNESLDNDYFINEFLLPAGITPSKVTRMQLTEARIEMVKAGLGITVLSRWLVRPFYQNNAALKLIKITKKGIYRPWYIAQLKDKRHDIHIKEFVSFLKDQQLGN